MSNSEIDLIRQNVRFYRMQKGLTQEQLSELADISCDYLSEIERKKKIPSLKRLLMIADALKVPPGNFFSEN